MSSTKSEIDEAICVLCGKQVSPKAKAFLATFREDFEDGLVFPCHRECLAEVASPSYGMTREEIRG